MEKLMITKESPEKIIIVDDIPALSFFIECLLHDAGFSNYQSFDDPKDALEHIKSNKPVDLIITDFYMPGMNGLELLKKAKEICNQIQGIIVSSAPSMISAETYNYVVMEKGKNLTMNLIEQVKKMVG